MHIGKDMLKLAGLKEGDTIGIYLNKNKVICMGKEVRIVVELNKLKKELDKVDPIFLKLNEFLYDKDKRIKELDNITQ